MTNLAAALEEQGYQCIFAIGYGQRADGTYSVKVAARPSVKALNAEEWRVLRETMIGAIDKMMTSELDDLEVQW